MHAVVRRVRTPAAVVALAYLAGTVPVANLVARARAGVDLRRVGTGTVSGTSLYAVTGFRALAVAGCVELAKGACGPLLAGRRRPALAAAAAAAAITGHNWSPWLGWGGGRGVSLVIGAGLAAAPEAALVVGTGLGLGRLAHRSGSATLLALLALPPVLGRTRGRDGFVLGCALCAPVLTKRLLGNAGRLPRSRATLWARLVADREAGGR